ncbi:interleukin-22 [Ochotona curzoniae]|uniref:interleukin-22 n=1 Tax=Ochotona curzoniae TaxID=130825 RepID=UPI001B34C537|nr:interleukin-22 [Ochotona curzoniae]
MAVLQKSMRSWLMGNLVAGGLLLMILMMHQGTALPISSHCSINESEFSSYITNRTFILAAQASLADNNTDVRLIVDHLFHGVNMTERCYLMKQVLNFTLEEVLLPQSDRSLPYMNEVVGFLKNLRNKLSLCHIEDDDQHIQENVQHLKDTVKMLGENGEIKVIGELNLLLLFLRTACV